MGVEEHVKNTQTTNTNKVEQNNNSDSTSNFLSIVDLVSSEVFLPVNKLMVPCKWYLSHIH